MANYLPPGNYMGRFNDNVLPPKESSQTQNDSSSIDDQIEPNENSENSNSGQSNSTNVSKIPTKILYNFFLEHNYTETR